MLSVAGENVREWTVADAKEAGQQTIHVALYTPARDAYTLRVKLERALGALPQVAPFPVLRTVGTERQTGTVAIFSDPELTTEVADLQELTQQAVSAEAKGQRAQGEYRYLHVPYAGKIAVAEAKAQVEVKSQTLVVVEPDRLSVEAVFDCEVKRAGIFSLAIGLPPGLTHVEAAGDGVESSAVAAAARKGDAAGEIQRPPHGRV